MRAETVVEVVGLPLTMQFAQFAIIAFGVSCTAVGLFFTWQEFRERNLLARRARLVERNTRQIAMDQTVEDEFQYFRTALRAEDRTGATETATADGVEKEGANENSEKEEGEAQ